MKEKSRRELIEDVLKNYGQPMTAKVLATEPTRKYYNTFIFRRYILSL